MALLELIATAGQEEAETHPPSPLTTPPPPFPNPHRTPGGTSISSVASSTRSSPSQTRTSATRATSTMSSWLTDARGTWSTRTTTPQSSLPSSCDDSEWLFGSSVWLTQSPRARDQNPERASYSRVLTRACRADFMSVISCPVLFPPATCTSDRYAAAFHWRYGKSKGSTSASSSRSEGS